MNIDKKKWMKDISDDRKLFTLNLVGTHDSVTQRVQHAYISQCQDLSIYDQLGIGVRALDIRVRSDKDKLATIHGFSKAFVNSDISTPLYLDYILEHCYTFLKQNPSEAVIFQFKNDNNSEMEKCFENLFYNYIRGNEDKWYLKSTVPTLGEARGKLVLVRRCSIDMRNKDYTPDNTGIDFSSWIEQDEIMPNSLVLETGGADNAAFVIQDRYKYKPEEKWNACIKPFLDRRKKFNRRYVICYLSTAGGIRGPRGNAKIINSYFMDYPVYNDKYYGLMYFDFPTAQLCDKMISTNL